jgi:hypothetical protein
MIKGTEGMSDAEIVADVEKGGRFVCYMYCFSILIMTFRRGTGVYYIRSGGSAVVKGLPWTLLTFVRGLWGFPWGPIYSIQCLYKNLSGGHDVTANIVRPPTA